MSETRGPRISYRPVLAVILSVLLLHFTLLSTGVSWGQTTGTVHSGEAVFRGLFFGTGPVAKEFPEIWDDPILAHYSAGPLKDNHKIARALSELRDNVVKRIAKKDPGFFQRFGEQIQSGDHLTVQYALDDASALLLEAMSAETGFDVTNPEAAPSNSSDLVLVVAVLVLAATAAVLVAALAVAAISEVTVINIATAVNEVRFYPFPTLRNETTRLQAEMWVDLVANRLAA